MTTLTFRDTATSLTKDVQLDQPLPVQIVAGGGASSPNKTEDTAATTGDTGTAVMAIQTAAPADKASEADYAFLQMSGGGLWTKAVGPATATRTSVNSVTTAGGVAILAANTARRGATITNTDANGLYLFFGATGSVSASDFDQLLLTGETLRIAAGEYTGAICGIWAADGAGAAKVCEFT